MLYWQYIFAQAPFPILTCSYWVLDYWITTMLEYWHLMNLYLHISDSIDLKLTQKYIIGPLQFKCLLLNSL